MIKLQDTCDKYAKIAVQKGRNEEPFFFSPLRNLTGLQWVVLCGTSLDDAEVELADYYKSLYWQQQNYYIYRACHNPLSSILKSTLLGLHCIATSAQEIVSQKISASSSTLYICQNLGIQPEYLQSFAEEHFRLANKISGGNHCRQREGQTPVCPLCHQHNGLTVTHIIFHCSHPTIEHARLLALQRIDMLVNTFGTQHAFDKLLLQCMAKQHHLQQDNQAIVIESLHRPTIS